MDPKLVFPFSHNNNYSLVKKFDSTTKFGYSYLNKELIDLSLGSCGCFPLGFDRTDFIDYVNGQLYKMPFLSGDYLTTNEYVLELADIMFDISNGYHSIFGINGSNAVEAAIKVAQVYQNLTGNKSKKLMLGFENSYHGSTYLSGSISGSTYFHNTFGRESNCKTLSYENVEEQINNLGPNNICCLIVETCSWQNGLHPKQLDWWLSLQDICNKNNIVLIVDDIAFCGYKTGKYFGFPSEIKPDVICTGKAMTGGYFSLSNCLINQKMFDVVKNPRFLHGFSYTFSMPGILSALYYTNVVKTEKVCEEYDSVKVVSESMFNRLKEINTVKQVRNYGLTWCIDIDTNKTEDEFADLFVQNGMYLGLWNHPSHKKQILIHTPSILSDYYFSNIEHRLSNLLKNV